MKSKIILLIAGAAVVTLSFTFATSSNVAEKRSSYSNSEAILLMHLLVDLLLKTK